MLPLSTIQTFVCRGHRMGRQPQDAVEGGHGVEAPIEPECVLVQVSLQVLLADVPVVSPQDPSLQVAEDEVDHRQMGGG